MADLVTLPSNAVETVDGRVLASSLYIAETFGKRHDNVLQSIDGLDCSAEFHALNFQEMVRDVQIGSGAVRQERYIEMTKDGFTFLVMGYRGKQAAQFKEAYIARFNEMERKLLEQQFTPPTEQLPMFLVKEELTADFKEIIRSAIHESLRGAFRGLIRAELRNALTDMRNLLLAAIQQAVTAGINATFKTPAEAYHEQQAQKATEAATKARAKAGKPDPQPEPIPPGRLDEGRHAEQRAQARERHHQDLRIEAVSGGTWKDYLRRHNISRLFTAEERQAMKAEFYQLQHACKPLAA